MPALPPHARRLPPRPRPDQRLCLCRSTPLIMHAGLVPHQHAKWMPPPDKWTSVPDAVGLSPSGECCCCRFFKGGFG